MKYIHCIDLSNFRSMLCELGLILHRPIVLMMYIRCLNEQVCPLNLRCKNKAVKTVLHMVLKM